MAGKRDEALVQAQRRHRVQSARGDLVLRAYFKAAEEVEGLSAEETALRARFDADLERLGLRRAASLARVQEMTAAVAVVIGDDARAAEVLGASERQVAAARRAVSLPVVLEAVDRILARGS